MEGLIFRILRYSMEASLCCHPLFSYQTHYLRFYYLLQDPKASHDFNDNDDDPSPRDVDPDNW